MGSISIVIFKKKGKTGVGFFYTILKKNHKQKREEEKRKKKKQQQHNFLECCKKLPEFLNYIQINRPSSMLCRKTVAHWPPEKMISIPISVLLCG